MAIVIGDDLYIDGKEKQSLKEYHKKEFEKWFKSRDGINYEIAKKCWIIRNKFSNKKKE